MHLPLLLSQLLSLRLPVNPTVLLLHLLLLIQLLRMFLTLLCTLITLYTGADVTIVGDIIVLNNPTFSAAMGASVVVTQLELMEHIILL